MQIKTSLQPTPSLAGIYLLWQDVPGVYPRGGHPFVVSMPIATGKAGLVCSPEGQPEKALEKNFEIWDFLRASAWLELIPPPT